LPLQWRVRRSKSPAFVDLKNKKEIEVRVTQFHTILKIRLLSFKTNVRGANTFLKRKYNSRTWNILYDRFPLVFPTFSTNKRWWRLRAFSSFGKRTREPRFACPQKVRLRQYPIPNKKILLNKLNSAKILSKFDMKSGFWQIQIQESERYKTTFTVPFGQYE